MERLNDKTSDPLSRERWQRPVILLGIGAFLLGGVGCTAGRTSSGPEPGSGAARYCDTNTTDPRSTTEYDGKHYDTECLAQYSWEK